MRLTPEPPILDLDSSAATVGYRRPARSVASPRRGLLLPPEVEFLLHPPVRVDENHRVARGRVLVRDPARRDENVVRAPVEGLPADLARACALAHGESRAVGGAKGRCHESPGDELHPGRYRRHAPAAIDRVDV